LSGVRCVWFIRNWS